MSRFNSFLHRTGGRLTLPPATRSLILVEIASDLDDLFQHYLSQGLSEEEAAARAEEKVDMSDEALSELVRIHSAARTWTDRIVHRAASFWEWMVMALIVLVFVAGAALGPDWGIFAHIAAAIWPVLIVFAILVACFVVQLLKGSHSLSPRKLRESLATPLFLGGASLVIGFGGVGIEIYRSLMRMAANPEHAGPVFVAMIIGGTSTLAVSLVVALCAGIAWFILAGRAARLENRAAQTFPEVS